jgi:hypothetical protein
MRKNGSCILGLTSTLVIAFAGMAKADVTIGNTTPPSGSFFGPCFQGTSGNDAFVQGTQDPSTPYTVPAGGGKIAQWQTIRARTRLARASRSLC